MPRRSSAALSALAVLAALAGCGGGPKPNDEQAKAARRVVADASAALGHVHSFHVEGYQLDNDGRSRISGDVVLPGRLHVTIDQAGKHLELVVIDSDAYFKANRAFWESIKRSPTTAMLADRWVKVPASAAPGFAQFATFTDPARVGPCFVAAHLGTLTKRGPTDVAGKRVVVLTDAGDVPGSAPGKLYVAATGDRLPLRAVQTGPQAPGGTPNARCNETADDLKSTVTRGDLSFSSYNKGIEIKPPKGVLDLTSPGGGNAA